jgi:hypothetical protein
MNSATVNVLYFSLATNDFDIVDPDEDVTRPQGYTTAGASVMYLPRPNPSYTPGLRSVQSNNPQPVFFQNLPPVLPEATMPLFDISTITHPNVQGSFNIRYSPTFSDNQLLGIFPANNAIEPLESLYSIKCIHRILPGTTSRVHLLRLIAITLLRPVNPSPPVRDRPWLIFNQVSITETLITPRPTSRLNPKITF